MKARWDWHDFDEMAHKPLAFTAEDIVLIHLGLAARAAGAMMARNAAAAAVAAR